MLESDIVRQIQLEVKRRGGKSIKLHGDMFSEKGTPDLLIVYKGFVALIEVKRPGQLPTPVQRVRITEWSKAGADSTYVTSVRDLCSCFLDEVDVLWDRVIDVLDAKPPSLKTAISFLAEKLDKANGAE